MEFKCGFATQVRGRISGCPRIRRCRDRSGCIRSGPCGWTGTAGWGTAPAADRSRADALARLANNENNWGIPDSEGHGRR